MKIAAIITALLFFGSCNAVKAQIDSVWQIVSHGRVEKYFPATVANGMTGILPSQQPLQIDKVVLNGVYDVYGRGEGVSNIVQGIDFLSVDIFLNGKYYLSKAPDSDLSDWEQRIDMKRAEIMTSFTWRGQLRIEQRICALRQLPYDGLSTIRIEALKGTSFTVVKAFKGSESAKINSMTFETIGNEKVGVFSSTAKSPTGKHTISAATCFIFSGKDKPALNYIENNRTLNFELNLEPKESFEFGVVGAICSTVNFDDPVNESKRLALFAYFEGVDKLIKAHREAWSNLWKSDIIIEGNPEDQRNVRFALYNLYSFAREGTSFSIPPMGLSGIGYNGHIFWDCELWMYPAIVTLQNPIAKSLLEYRYNRLKAAEDNAYNHGYRGAMFPWESAETGMEETPVFALTGPLEHHVSSDIAIAFWNYYLVTRDLKWLREKGYGVIAAVADFWTSRVELNDKGEYEIKKVVGSDEFAENVDNDAFTNGGAIITLRLAGQAAKLLGKTPNPKWELVAKNIPLRYFKDGTIKEHETYNGDTIKQADVNLLTYPLNFVQNKDLMVKNLSYYLPKLSKNGPAMGKSIFAVIYARLGDSKTAYQLFKESYEPNLRPPFGVLAESAFSDNPYFATGAGGLLHVVLFGFGGLHFSPEGIVQKNPILPAGWKSLTLTGVGIEKKTFTVK
jgi:trehalose/maltose hydrolase-like predicted phosphorylase